KDPRNRFGPGHHLMFCCQTKVSRSCSLPVFPYPFSGWLVCLDQLPCRFSAFCADPVLHLLRELVSSNRLFIQFQEIGFFTLSKLKVSGINAGLFLHPSGFYSSGGKALSDCLHWIPAGIGACLAQGFPGGRHLSRMILLFHPASSLVSVPPSGSNCAPNFGYSGVVSLIYFSKL